MRKIKVEQSIIGQLENIKGFEDSTDEVYAIIGLIDDDYTAGYVQAVVEAYTDSITGDALIEETIDFLELLIKVHGEEEK